MPKTVSTGVKLVGLEELMEESDFVSVHARLTKDTEKMISEELLGKMKHTAYFINTSRSGLVDEDALYRALKEKRIAGAALDVYNVEPPGKDYPIVTLDNVTLTPHMAGGTVDVFLNSPKLMADDLASLWKDEMPRFVFNKETFKRVWKM